MVFSSLFFLFIYLPVVISIYYITPCSYRNIFLLLANLAFYGWGEPVYIIIMIASIFIDYTHGLLVEKFRHNDKFAKYIVCQSVVLNLSLLIFFKYFDFILLNLQKIVSIPIEPLGLSLPIGISFYTFQTMSYTIDIYRNEAKAQRKIVDFGVFVTLFPQLIAGPIVKYKDISNQLINRTTNIENFSSGIKLFCIGLFKKVMLANNIGMLWTVYSSASELSVLGAWLGAIAFSLQLYFDFSGYSDMARGLGRMLGFEFLPNFNFPYISKSATEFWRRWHISLGSWFKEYVYIPLGGSKCGKFKTFRNIIVVWALTGIWHGASWNFALWGIYYSVILIIEKLFLLKILKKIPSVFSHIYTLFVVIIAWMLFAIEDTSSIYYIKSMLGFSNIGLIDSQTLYYFKSYFVTLVVCILCSMPIIKIEKETNLTKILDVVFVFASLVICTAYLVDATFNPFLYFRF